jgi:hypothetical protein
MEGTTQQFYMPVKKLLSYEKKALHMKRITET